MRTTRAFDTPLLDTSLIKSLMRRQAATLSGLGLIALCALAVVAMATWSVSDPSLSHATAAPVTNMLGAPGAIFADLIMQVLGLGAVLALVPITVWGWHLMTYGGLNDKPRRALQAFGFVAAGCALLALMPLSGAWPLPIGLGGLLGDALIALPSKLIPVPFVPGLLVAALALPAAALLFMRTAATPVLSVPPSPSDMRIEPRRIHRADGVEEEMWDEDEPDFDDDDRPGRAQLAMGYATHLGYSGLAAAKRLLPSKRRAYPPVRPDLGQLNARLRASEEPQFSEDAPYYAPENQAVQQAHYQEPQQHEAQPQWAEPQLAPIAQPTAQPMAQPIVQAAPQPVPHAPHTDDWSQFEPAPPHEAAVPADMLAYDSENPAAWADQQDAAQPAPVYAPQPAPIRGPAARSQQGSTARVTEVAKTKPGKRAARERQPQLIKEAQGFELPPLHLLSDAPSTGTTALSPQALERNAGLLEGVLEDFRVTGEVINVCPGPVVTLYEFEPAPGVKSARVIGLADDIARSMSAISARVAVIPGRNAIGIELPNNTRETVYLSEILASQNFEKAKGNLPLAMGKTIGGEPVIADLARMPHLLVAGTTGSGKSVAINTMILSILYRWTPEECRLILIDPKMLELSVYDGIPHLLTPVVTDPGKAVVALKWAVKEMEDRYRKMSKLGVRNIDGFNTRVKEAQAKGETISRTVQTGFDEHTGEAVYEREELSYEAMPMLVIVVDEMADLMMVAGKEIEGAIQRLAQMARAAGIHIVMATQRPSVDVITGTIKANFPTRCSFQVTSKIDSRTILGEQGGEQLLGQGDMLFMAGGGRIQRVHGPFVSDEEVELVVDHLKTQGAPDYLHTITEEIDEDDDAGGDPTEKSIARLEKSDDPYEQAIAVVMRDKKASTSYVQRRLGIGYNRAASLIERMEKEGLIGPANHAGKREVLMQVGEEDGFGG
ncbi:MAG: DNA translocase FtsK 4TM domain-containing protein [Devosiaceae bacterium]